MRIAFFEDRCASDFGPIALTRPVFELVCGRFSLRERAVRTLGVTAWGTFLREHLAETYREAFPEARVNDGAWLAQGPTLFLNGRCIADHEALRSIDPQTIGLIDGTVAFVT